MSKKRQEQILSQDEYFARMEQGVPVGDCWVDMGNGQFAYALQEVVVTARQLNKYGDKVFMTRTVSVLAVADNTRVDTRARDEHIRYVEKQLEFERRKKEVTNKLYNITKEYFRNEKAKAFLNKPFLEKLQFTETVLLLGIPNDKTPLSTAAFPTGLYQKESALIDEFVQIRTVTAIEFRQRDPGTIKRSPTGYEKWMMERKQLDPFAYQMGSRPEIQIVAVALLGSGAISYASSAGAFSLETNMTAAAIKGGASFVGQAVAGDGVQDVNLVMVASSAFLYPGAGAVAGNIVEIRPFEMQEPFKAVGYNKTLGEFGIQAATSYGTGKVGNYGFNKFSRYLETPKEQTFYNIFYNTWMQIISSKVSNKLTTEYEQQNKEDN
jgi:hypothetical protein